jgi:hypothetical protein
MCITPRRPSGANPQEEVMKAIDPKYSIDGEHIVKTATGERIPDDEPLILFRARDRHAARMLHYYRGLCRQDECTEFHMRGIKNRIDAFEQFAREHGERMKQPGITKGL